MTLSERTYAASPSWLQHAFVSAYGWQWRRLRLGGEWSSAVHAFRQRDGFSRDQWRDFTVRRLREVLTAAAERTPHYSQQWARLGFTSARLARFEPEDLPSLPILQKDDVRRAPRSLLVGGVPPPTARVYHTSGSTGTPIAVYATSAEMQRSMALREARSAGWAGVSFLGSRATFSGRPVVPRADSRGPFHRYNVFERQIYFSAFHLGPETVGQYVAALRRYRPDWLTGYAYSYYTLARLARDQGLRCPSPKAIVTTSEKVTPAMRSTIEDVFGCKVYEEYGTVEDVMFASECERGGLHVNPDAGFVEIVDDDGQPVDAGRPGRVICTGFLRDSQLFVRFALGDEAAWAGRSCSCGRAMPLLQEVTGRIEDAVIGPDGRQMVRFHGIFVDQPHVSEGQIVQETLHDITVRIVPVPGFGPADEAEIRRRVHARLTTEVRVEVIGVPEIARTASGKFQAVISKVARAAAPAADA